MYPNVKASEQIAILGAVPPSSQAAGTLSTGWISMANFQKLLAILQTGTMANSKLGCGLSLRVMKKLSRAAVFPASDKAL